MDCLAKGYECDPPANRVCVVADHLWFQGAPSSGTDLLTKSSVLSVCNDLDISRGALSTSCPTP